MRLIIQRVTRATVNIEGIQKAAIQQGLLILLGIEGADTEEDVDWLCRKLVAMRIFSDQTGNMNLSVKDIDGELLIISQFTLHASVKKGNRPGFTRSARPIQAIPLYENFIKKSEGLLPGKVKTGEFGADMKVELINDGPVTIIMDSRNRE